MAPDTGETISGTGVQEMRTVAATAAAAIGGSVNEAVTTTLGRSELFKTSAVGSTHNWDTDYTPGNKFTGGVENVEGQVGLAEKVPSNVIVGGSGTQFSATQIQIPVAGGLRFWVRAKLNSSTWTPWVDLAASGGGSGAAPMFGAGTPNQLRIQAFQDDYPLVSTGNKGCVVFRYDHGLTNFKSTLKAMHDTAGIPYYIAMNSRLWGEPENSGATQADAKAWIASGLAEFGNHTADHKDRDTAEGIWDTVVNGRTELEAQLGTIIHGFTVPGVTEFDKFGGFDTGSLDSYSGTYMGEVVLANHAICSGAVGSAQRPLDGQIAQGGRHYTWQSQGFANIKAQIDSAIANKTALTLMAHPSVMGGVGMFDAALAQQVIDYVKSKIDSGDLANLSYYQSHHAALAAPVFYGDTGDRNITKLWDGGAGGGTVTLSRTGQNVELVAYQSVATVNASKYTLPAGFRPSKPMLFDDPLYGANGLSQRAIVTTSGSVSVFGTNAGDTIYTVLAWTTRDAWPATLPGTA